jgi:sialate O-acetylesterase
MDAADPYDIHPTNKQVAGRRVAGVMRTLLYGEPGTPDGLAAISARRDGDEVVLDFSASGTAPVVSGSGTPAGFELCGDEPESCAWANAVLDGALIRLDGANAATATRVRHAWADTPIVNLFGEGGPPAGSFEVPISD